MGLASSKGKKYAIEQIFPRHFFQTAKTVGFERSAMEEILTELANSVDDVIKLCYPAIASRLPRYHQQHHSRGA